LISQGPVFVSLPDPNDIVNGLGDEPELKYDIYTFWSLEEAFPGGQLRYHAGQVAMLHLMKRLAKRGFTVHALICDSQARSLLLGQSTSTEPDVGVTSAFISSLGGTSITVGRMSDYIKKMPTKGSSHGSVDPDLVIQGALEFRNAIQAVKPDEEVLKELEKYRIFSANHIIAQPVQIYLQKLRLKMPCSSVTDGELLAALYASLRRPKWFDAFWLGEMAAWLASKDPASDRDILILEANRSAYSWLTHQCFLKLGMTGSPPIVPVKWPAMCFVDPLLALNGQGPMELSKPKNALFIASSPERISNTLERTTEEVLKSFSQWFDVDFNAFENREEKLNAIKRKLLLARAEAMRAPGLSKVNTVAIDSGNMRQSDEPPNIALCLSGGGFRATFFHLGTVSLLRQSKLLQNVQAIYSVSGGSILAANLALNWEKYLSTDDEFKKASAPLFDLTKANPRGKLLWATLFGLLSFRGPKLLASLYAKKAQIHGELQNLPRKPALHILATSIKSGELVSFSRNGLICGSEMVGGKHLPLSQAVAASSAFPPLLAPVVLTAGQLIVKERTLGADLERLTDGGIYDNLGYRKILDDIRSGKDEHACDTVLSSDASAPFSQTRGERYLSLFGRTARTTDILMKRVADLESERAAMNDATHRGHLSPNLVRVNIETNVTQFDVDSHIGASKYRVQDEVVQSHVANIRTDLNQFSNLEIAALMRHGYETALLRLASDGLLPGDFVPQDPWLALSLKSTSNVSEIREKITAASVRRYTGSKILFVLIALTLWGFFGWRNEVYEFVIRRGIF